MIEENAQQTGTAPSTTMIKTGTKPAPRRKRTVPRSASIVAGRVAQRRAYLHLTAEGLAKRAGLSVRKLSQLGRGAKLKFSALEGLARALDWTIEQLLGADRADITMRSSSPQDPPPRLNPAAETTGSSTQTSPLATDPIGWSREASGSEPFKKVLAEINPSDVPIPADAHGDRDWVERRMRSARLVRVITYAGASWRHDLERQLLGFLKKGGELRILRLAPGSAGHLEKTAMEAYAKIRDGNDASRWREETSDIRKLHHETAAASLTWMRTLCSQGSVACREFADLPNYVGWLFDHDALLLSTYMLDPIERGFRLPAIRITEADQHFAILSLAFRNWFDVKFALGPDPLKVNA